MTTHEFVAGWVAKRQPTRVLDYGCGAGQIVGLLRARGIEAWGCDVFYDGGSHARDVPLELRPYIHAMAGDVIPFDSGAFDLVLSNQVFEHVPDMEVAVHEIARVLRPGGIALNVFPDRGVWREGHCGIPFLHWFPKHSRVRLYYAATLRALGMGYFKKDLSVMRWSRDFCEWLDKWTYYRSRREILERFNRLIGTTAHAEEDWLRARFDGKLDALPVALQRLIVRKVAGVVLVSTCGPSTA